MWPFPRICEPRPAPKRVTNDAADMIFATENEPVLRLEVITINANGVTLRPVIDVKNYQTNPIWAGETITVREGDSVMVPHQLFTLRVET